MSALGAQHGGAEPMPRATRLDSATQYIHHSPSCPSAVILPFCGESFPPMNRDPSAHGVQEMPRPDIVERLC